MKEKIDELKLEPSENLEELKLELIENPDELTLVSSKTLKIRKIISSIFDKILILLL